MFAICAIIAFVVTFPLSGMYLESIEELFVDFIGRWIWLCALCMGYSKTASLWFGAPWIYRLVSEMSQQLIAVVILVAGIFIPPSWFLRGFVPDQWRFCVAALIGLAGFALLTFTLIGFERLRIFLSLRICGRDPWTTARTSVPYESPPSTPLQTWLRSQKIERARRLAVSLFVSFGAFRLIVIGSLDCTEGCGWMSAHGRKCMTLGWMLLSGDLLSPLVALLSLPRRKGIASLVVVVSIVFCSAIHIAMIGVDDVWGSSIAIAVASLASLYSFAIAVLLEYGGIPFFRSLPSLPLTLTEDLVASLPPLDDSVPSEDIDIPRDPRPIIRKLQLASHNCEYVRLPNISTSSGCQMVPSAIIIAIALVVSGFCVNFEVSHDLNPGMNGFVGAIAILTVLLLFGLAVLRVCLAPAIEGAPHEKFLRCVGVLLLWIAIIIFALIDPLWGVRWRPLNMPILLCVGLFVIAVVVRRIWQKAAYPNAHSDQRSLIGLSDFSIALLLCIIWTNIVAFQMVIDLQQTIIRLVMVSFIWAGVVGLLGPLQYPEYPDAEPERALATLPVHSGALLLA